MTDDEFLKMLQVFLDERETIKTNMTFLEVIDQTDSENYLSRMLAYCMATDMDFVYKLIKIVDKEVTFNNLRALDVKCEKGMDGKRADVFARFFSSGGELTITVENKNRAWEHRTLTNGDVEEYQTDTYYRWVQSTYPKCKNYYIYLKPDGNESTPNSDFFHTVLYSSLIDILQSNDYIVIDFKKHIMRHLGGLDMPESKEISYDKNQIKMIEEYSNIRKMQEKTAEYISEIQNRVFKKLEERRGDYETETDGSDFVTSYRYYNKAWWKEVNKSAKYYCYIEIRFDYDDCNNILNEIRLQEIVKTYSKSEYKDKITKVKHQKKCGSNLLIRDYKEFNTQKEIGSNEWVDELCKQFREYVSEKSADLDGLVRDFEGLKD